MKQTCIGALALFLYFLPFIAGAQLIVIQESPQSMDDYLHDFFQPAPGHYIAPNYADPHGAFTSNRNARSSSITSYDTRLKPVYSGEINALTGKKYQGGLESDKRLHIFYSGDSDVFMDELDLSTGQLKGSPVQLFKFANEPATLLKGFSADSSYCYALFKCAAAKSKDEIFQGVIMNRKMDIITRFS